MRVHFQVVEGTRRRTQVYEGIVIKRQGHGVRETFTVRKQSFGVGVERTFPLHSPKIERVEVAARGDVRRAKLYYLRGRVGKRARVRERRNVGPEQLVDRDLVHAPPEVPEDALPEVEEPTAEVEEPTAEVEESTAEVEESTAEVGESSAGGEPETPNVEADAGQSEEPEEAKDTSHEPEQPAAGAASESDQSAAGGEPAGDE